MLTKPFAEGGFFLAAECRDRRLQRVLPAGGFAAEGLLDAADVPAPADLISAVVVAINANLDAGAARDALVAACRPCVVTDGEREIVRGIGVDCRSGVEGECAVAVAVKPAP